jgi:hypothetical protein
MRTAAGAGDANNGWPLLAVAYAGRCFTFTVAVFHVNRQVQSQWRASLYGVYPPVRWNIASPDISKDISDTSIGNGAFKFRLQL